MGTGLRTFATKVGAALNLPELGLTRPCAATFCQLARLRRAPDPIPCPARRSTPHQSGTGASPARGASPRARPCRWRTAPRTTR